MNALLRGIALKISCEQIENLNVIVLKILKNIYRIIRLGANKVLIQNGKTKRIVKGYDGYECNICKSNNTKTILIRTTDSDYMFNKYLIKCKNCGNEFWIQDR